MSILGPCPLWGKAHVWFKSASRVTLMYTCLNTIELACNSELGQWFSKLAAYLNHLRGFLKNTDAWNLPLNIGRIGLGCSKHLSGLLWMLRRCNLPPRTRFTILLYLSSLTDWINKVINVNAWNKHVFKTLLFIGVLHRIWIKESDTNGLKA